jgi:cytochrome b-561
MSRESAFVRWWNERLDLDRAHRKYLRKAFPVHSTFFLGEMALFAFLVLVLTGIYLAFLYEPSTAEVEIEGQRLPAAYGSVVLLDKIPTAYLIRQIHHWSAHVMIAALVLHLLRVFFTGAYKKPREINWIVGLGLLGLAIFAAFVGYLLPYDQFSVTATGIGYNIAKSVPWVGEYVADLVFAGKFPGSSLIPRFYGYHIMLLPLLLFAGIGVHLLILIKQKHTEPPAARAYSTRGGLIGIPLWPHQAVIMLVLALAMGGALTLLGTVFPAHPVEFYGPPAPETPTVKPDWYLMWVYGALRLIPGWMEVHLLGATIGSEAIGGILLPGLVILGLALLPWLDRTNRAKLEYLEPPTWHPARLGWGVAFLALIGVFTLAAYDDELGLSKAGLRLAVVVVPLLAGGLAYLGARARAQRLAARSGGPAAAGAPAAPVIPSANQTATKGGST